ncbi:MAG: cytochrome C [Polyangiales bacterium]
MRGARWSVIALTLAAVGCFAASFQQVWWKFTLYAPQYPKGLSLDIRLTGMGGDVHEIDMLNHYIGMAHLEDAAPLERRLAGYAVAALAMVVIALAMLAGKRIGAAALVPAMAFPVIFLGDSFGWLYHFGHALDPHAPLRLKAFTPQLFGNGEIGQFMTYAAPAAGFWLAVAAVPLMITAVVVRHRVCARCSHGPTCGLVCPHALIGPKAGLS